MSQLASHWITAEDMVRSRAWRMGYESARRGLPPDFMCHGRQALAYEYGRLTAAFLLGEGKALPRLPLNRPIDSFRTRPLALALMCVTEGAGILPPRPNRPARGGPVGWLFTLRPFRRFGRRPV
jgi:hypothetical protein